MSESESEREREWESTFDVLIPCLSVLLQRRLIHMHSARY